jgi:hypothetical protein
MEFLSLVSINDVDGETEFTDAHVAGSSMRADRHTFDWIDDRGEEKERGQ